MINHGSKSYKGYLKDLQRALLNGTSKPQFSYDKYRLYVLYSRGRAGQIFEQHYNDLEVGEPLEG